MNIKTERHGHDNWIAFDSDCDPESDKYCVGYGASPEEAVIDYNEQVLDQRNREDINKALDIIDRDFK